MKVLLLEDIRGLGKKWDVVNVKKGYARNFLVPKKMAKVVNDSNKREYEHLQKVIKQQREKDQKKFQLIYELLNEKIFTMQVQSTEIGTLYNAIDTVSIAKSLIRSIGKSISSEFLSIESNIKELGSYKVLLNYNAEKKGYFWLYVVSF